MIKAILEDLRSIKSSREELKKFAFTMAAVLALVAAVSFFKKREIALYYSAGSSVFFFFWGLVYPPLLKPVQKVWMGLAVFIGFFMSRILISVLFFLAITPIGLLLRCMGKDILTLKRAKGSGTYWNDHETKEITKESYERQY